MQTPYFIIDEEILDENIKKLDAALSKNFSKTIKGYSFKTNSLPWLIQKMKRAGFYAEVVSPDEYALALALGYLPEKIIYNGPAKNEDTFRQALRGGSILNLETSQELSWLKKYAKPKDQVGIRLQIDVESLCPGESVTGEIGGRFGYPLANLPEILEFFQSLKLKIAGLHVHTSSKTRSLNIYQALAKAVYEIISNYQLEVDYVDIGGGFFGGANAKPDFFDYFSVIKKELATLPFSQALTLIVEPGASLIATPVSYTTKVLEHKTTERSIFITTDGLRLHIDPFLRKDTYQVILPEKKGSLVKKQRIVGATCMENDHFFLLENFPLLERGDEITYEKVGSYTMCFNALFIHYFPDVYVKKGDQKKLVRKRWGVSEYLQNSEVDKNETVDFKCR